MKLDKRKIGFYLSNKRIYKYFVLLNMCCFHFNTRRHRKKYGQLNKDKIFYVIRPSSKVEGLLSCYLSVLREIKYAQSNNYIPIVDYLNYENQYTRKEKVNSWELFFSQVSDYALEEVYKSKNVFLSGWSIKDILTDEPYETYINVVKNYKNINTNISINDSIIKKAERIEADYIDEKTLGIFIRGTDYIALKPKGHYRQPTVEMIIKKAKDYIVKYEIEEIYLVTEDIMIADKIKKELTLPVKIFGENVVSSYKGDDYLFNSISEHDVHNNAINYLIRILLLSKCRYLVSSITNATFFLLSLEYVEYEDSYFFDIGKYD